jgi:hypothetical protein
LLLPVQVAHAAAAAKQAFPVVPPTILAATDCWLLQHWLALSADCADEDTDENEEALYQQTENNMVW